MMKLFSFLTILGLFFLPFTLKAIDYIPLKEVVAGMEGKGKTIFKGTNIESFNFKVLGIIENFAPGKNLIIVELSGSPELAEGGIYAGMSGSPVFIQNRLLGSVSYGFSFSKKAIAGVTPVEDMLKVDQFKDSTLFEPGDIKIEINQLSIQELGRKILERFNKRISWQKEGWQPLPFLVSLSGFSPKMTGYSPLFNFQENLKIKEQVEKILKKDNLELNAADAVAIPLIRGDFEYSASGTVTFREGDKLYIFGHPFFNLGKVEYPIHKAEVITLVPAYNSSFKLTATRNPIGIVEEDRFSAVVGRLAKTPRMIPIKIFLRDRNRNYNIEIVNHSLLSPVLTYFSLLNVFNTEYQELGAVSLKVSSKIFIEGYPNVSFTDVFVGNNAFEDCAYLFLALNYFLINNPEKAIRLQKLDFEIEASSRLKKTALRNVLIQKNSFSPGEEIKVSLQLYNEREGWFEEKLSLPAPNLPPGSIFYLMVAGANEMGSFESKYYSSSYFPTTLTTLIRAINNIRKNNRLYFKFFNANEGVLLEGYEFPNVSASLKEVLNFNSISNNQTSILLSTLLETYYEVPNSVVNGQKLIKLAIKGGLK